VKQIRKRLTYANVMSSIAVFLILGGATALAAKKIGTSQLKASAVTTGKIKKEAVTTAKIKKQAVTGAKIKLSTVGKVPSAAAADTAGNANTVGGNTIVAINFSGNPIVGPTQVLNLDGFTLTATCTGGNVLSVVANGPSGSRLQSSGTSTATGVKEVLDAVFNDTLTPTSNTQLLTEDDDLVSGKTEFSLGNGGRAVSVVWEAESFEASSGPHCTFTGYAIG
jgi:hypothetical protein